MNKTVLVKGKCPNCAVNLFYDMDRTVYETELKKSFTGMVFDPQMPKCSECGNTIKYVEAL